jgi:hypothetical protein
VRRGARRCVGGGCTPQRFDSRANAGGILITDMPSGETFYVNADKLPAGGQDPIRRMLLNSNGAAKTMLQVIQEKNRAQGKPPAPRSDLRLSLGPDNHVFLLNRGDGTIRVTP